MSSPELQTDEFIEKYLNDVMLMGNNVSIKAQVEETNFDIENEVLPYEFNQEDWKKRGVPIQTHIQQMFEVRVGKIREDLLRQDQCSEHVKIQKDTNILFG